MLVIDGEIFMIGAEIDGEIGVVEVVEERGRETYEGPYEVTPTRDTQTLSTEDKIMIADVTVNPIPSNYGLITHDGFAIRIS